jgi:hypothetical protein
MLRQRGPARITRWHEPGAFIRADESRGPARANTVGLAPRWPCSPAHGMLRPTTKRILPMNTSDAVQQLLDLEAIKTLKHRYIRCMTQSRWDELQTLLAPDVQASYSDGKYVFSDRATLMGFLRQQDPSGVPQLSYWHVTMPEITLHAPDRASGIWAMYHFHLQKKSSSNWRCSPTTATNTASSTDAGSSPARATSGSWNSRWIAAPCLPCNCWSAEARQ